MKNDVGNLNKYPKMIIWTYFEPCFIFHLNSLKFEILPAGLSSWKLLSIYDFNANRLSKSQSVFHENTSFDIYITKITCLLISQVDTSAFCDILITSSRSWFGGSHNLGRGFSILRFQRQLPNKERQFYVKFFLRLVCYSSSS